MVTVWADFKQAIVDKAIYPWRKRPRSCVKVEGEHFEHLLWLAVAYCVLLRRIVSNNLNVSVIFDNTAFYEWHVIDSVSVPIVTLCLLVVCYTSVMCNFNSTSRTNYALCVQCTYKNIAIKAVFMTSCHKVTGVRVFLTNSVVLWCKRTLRISKGITPIGVPNVSAVGKNCVFRLTEKSPAETLYRRKFVSTRPVTVISAHDGTLAEAYAVSSTTLVINEVCFNTYTAHFSVTCMWHGASSLCDSWAIFYCNDACTKLCG